MANPPKSDTLSSELEERLNDLFREDNLPAERPAPAARSAPHPLAELKKVVLSIDWEITPETLESFLDQVRQLKKTHRAQPAVAMLLQILESLGHYIQTSRSKVHPSTFNVLNSVFARLEQIVNEPKMPDAAKRRLLKAEVAAYQQLREKVSRRQAKAAAPAAADKEPARAGSPGGVTPEMLAQAVAELKEFIRNEIRALQQQWKLSAPRR